MSIRKCFIGSPDAGPAGSTARISTHSTAAAQGGLGISVLEAGLVYSGFA